MFLRGEFPNFSRAHDPILHKYLKIMENATITRVPDNFQISG